MTERRIGRLGMFNELNWPDIEGLDEFTGTVFHSMLEARYNEALQHDMANVGVWAVENCHNYYPGAGGRRTARLDPDAYVGGT